MSILGGGLGKMITINELFSGIGAQVVAFKRLNISYKVIGISEIDKYAIQSYEAINGPTQKNAYVGSCENYSPCLTSAMGMGGGQIPMLSDNIRIRKLTPRECWRLMGFTDIEFESAQLSGISNTQLYKQAGNSIVVNVLVAIFKELFNDRP